MPQVAGTFLLELANYLNTNNSARLVGLQVMDPYPSHMLELVLLRGTSMLDVSNVNRCASIRQTVWKFVDENGEPRVC
jgi:hypothetical protein